MSFDLDAFIKIHKETVSKKTEIEIELENLKSENEKMRAALEKLSKRHEWSHYFDQPCVCSEHKIARQLLAEIKGGE